MLNRLKKNFLKSKSKKAQAGMQLFTGIVVSIFMIGLIVMSFTLLGNKVIEEAYETGTRSSTELNFNLTSTDGGFNLTDCGKAYESSITSVTSVINSTGGETVDSGNYTYSNCKLYPIVANYNNTLVNVSYSYNSITNYGDLEALRSTTTEVADVPDWFGLFILMGAMVVIILMVVLIISAIKQANMGSGGTGV